MKMNRRQAIRCSILTAAALGQGRLLAALGRSRQTSAAAINPRQTLFQPMEESTLALLEQYFPKYTSSADLTSLLPYTAVIRNGGKERVKAYEMRWVQNTNGTDVTKFSQIFVSRPSSAPHSAIGTGWNTILHRGEYAVVTPLFLWSATKFRRNGGAVPVSKLMMDRDGGPAFIAEASVTGVYRVRRDAKIGRHVAIGNISAMTSEYQATVNYEKNIADLLLHSAGAPAALASVTADFITGINPLSSGLGSRVKLRYLRSVQARIASSGPEATWAGVQRIASRTTLQLKQRARVPVSTIST